MSGAERDGHGEIDKRSTPADEHAKGSKKAAAGLAQEALFGKRPGSQAAALAGQAADKSDETKSDPTAVTQNPASNDQHHDARKSWLYLNKWDNPLLSAYSLRAGYHGLKGDLFISKENALSKLKQTSSVGEALVQRAATMEESGWSIGRMKIND